LRAKADSRDAEHDVCDGLDAKRLADTSLLRGELARPARMVGRDANGFIDPRHLIAQLGWEPSDVDST
jgi:hypothetical protein